MPSCRPIRLHAEASAIDRPSHPLAGKLVVLNRDLETGALVRVVGWSVHLGRVKVEPLGELFNGRVAVHVRPEELPNYGHPLGLAVSRVAKVLTAALHALRSYQHGNAATDLARSTADLCDHVLAGGEA